MNQIVGVCDGAHENSCVWLCLCPYTSYIDHISTCQHEHMLYIRYCECSDVVMYFFQNVCVILSVCYLINPIAVHTVHTRTHKWNACGYRMQQNVFMVPFITSKSNVVNYFNISFDHIAFTVKLYTPLPIQYTIHPGIHIVLYVSIYSILDINWWSGVGVGIGGQI